MGDILLLIQEMWWVMLMWIPIIAGAYWYWRSRRKRTVKHDVFFIRADMTCDMAKLEATSGFLVDHRRKRAWFLDQDALVEDEDGNMHMVVTEDSAVPHYPGMSGIDRDEKAKECRGVRTLIAEQHLDQALAEVESDPNTDWFQRAGFAAVISSMAVIVLLVVVALATTYL